MEVGIAYCGFMALLIFIVIMSALVATFIEKLVERRLNFHIGLIGAAIIFFTLFCMCSQFAYKRFFPDNQEEVTKQVMLNELKEVRK